MVYCSQETTVSDALPALPSRDLQANLLISLNYLDGPVCSENTAAGLHVMKQISVLAFCPNVSLILPTCIWIGTVRRAISKLI